MPSTHMSPHPGLLSDEYREQLRLMREAEPNWGNGGAHHVPLIVKEINSRHPRTVLDYGCGRGNILTKLRTSAAFTTRRPEFRGYDPGIPEYSGLPEPADAVVSTDVLEHIEPSCLPAVLAHIRELTGSWAYLNIHTGPAKAILPDGRNAHLIQQPAAWWHEHLTRHFDSVTCIKPGSRPTFICEVVYGRDDDGRQDTGQT